MILKWILFQNIQKKAKLRVPSLMINLKTRKESRTNYPREKATKWVLSKAFQRLSSSRSEGFKEEMKKEQWLWCLYVVYSFFIKKLNFHLNGVKSLYALGIEVGLDLGLGLKLGYNWGWGRVLHTQIENSWYMHYHPIPRKIIIN